MKNASTIQRLEDAISSATGSDEIHSVEGCELLAAASEALGRLKTLSEFDLYQTMKDMASMAAASGHVPDHFLYDPKST